VRGVSILFVGYVSSGCANSTDPEWQLRHDRIIAIRTTPATVAAGGTAMIDAFVTDVGGTVSVEPPIAASTGPSTPPSLGDAVVPDGAGGWLVAAPKASVLDAVRMEIGLDPAAPIPLQIVTTFAVGGQMLEGTKTVELGAEHDNPSLGPVTIDGVPPAAPIVVPFDTDVALAIDVDSSFQVNWLTSCGSFNNSDNEHAAMLHVHPTDARTGELVVVVRDTEGGVAWQNWSIMSAAR
jgi:hypothetical protein